MARVPTISYSGLLSDKSASIAGEQREPSLTELEGTLILQMGKIRYSEVFKCEREHLFIKILLKCKMLIGSVL